MSGFGGFGQSGNQQSTGFGGFGSNNNAGPGFGTNSNTGFGTPSSTPLFGSNNQQQSTSAFGAGGFGSGNTGNAFGSNQTSFGANTSSGGGLFGASTSTAGTNTGFGSFGSNANNNNNTGALFGGASAPKAGFGASNTGGSLFGNNNTSGNAFGANNQSNSAFGAPLGQALGTNTDSSPGTGGTPFQAHTEKEGQTSTNNVFHSISAMQAYLKFSPEELRLVDYNQGRRFGNTGGFGTGFGSTGFGGSTTTNTGGFGGSSTGGGGLFGAQSAGTGGFGSNQTNPGLGANNNSTGGGLFAQNANKPATSGLFGNTSNTNAQSGGGLFANNNQGGFGASQPQNQSSGFNFGTNNNNANNTTTGGGGLFGNTQNPNTGGGGLFGGTSGGANLFGNNNQQQGQPNSTFGNFGQNQQNQQNQGQGNTGNAFGGFGGNNQQKPGGLFGGTASNTNTGGGLFGNTGQNNQQSTSAGGLFNQSGGGLFGAKPATTGSNLFGTATANTNNNTTSGSLFGGFNNNTQNQSQTGGSSLFGNTNQQQQKPGGLFGGTATNTAGGLFGSSNQQPATNSLFGQTNNANNAPQQQQQQPGGGMFGQSNNTASNSLFGNSQQQPPNILQPPQAMTASLTDQFPWGSASIFAGLPPPPQASPGPIATPINVPQKQRKSTILPQYKLSPAAAASRLVTPQRRGYGFTYSTYGTPSSVQSNASTPGGFSASRLNGSLTRSLGKSLSTSNLRRSFDPDAGESLLSPGAFSAGSSRYSGGGSLKRLTIDRNLRTDLFGSYAASTLPSSDKGDQGRQPGILKKKVSFDTSTVGGNGGEESDTTLTNGESSTATPSAQEQGFLRPRSNGRTPNSKVNGVSAPPDMEQVRGNELAVVHEDGSPEPPPASTSRSSRQSQEDQTPGSYYMAPSRPEIARMSKQERGHLVGFKVGREGCGFVTFDEPVDLDQVPLDDIFGKIVVIEIRSLTVYPSNIKKPSQGSGLNVPSTIHLENSWPRQRNKITPTYEKSGPRFEKHIERLRRVNGTEFVRYEKDTGTWVFKVPHFTTYALDYDETESEGESLHQSRMDGSSTSPTPTQTNGNLGSEVLVNSSMQDSPSSVQSRSEATSSLDDTFEFRRHRALPGTFGYESEADENIVEADEEPRDMDSFSEDSPASISEDEIDEPSNQQASDEDAEDRSRVVQDTEGDMAGTYPEADNTLDNMNHSPTPTQTKYTFVDMLGNIRTPPQLRMDHTAWTEALQDTISPYKHDRQRIQKSEYPDSIKSFKRIFPVPHPGRRGRGDLTTSIDLMNSLFGQEEARRSRTDVAALGESNTTQRVYTIHPSHIPPKTRGNPLNHSSDSPQLSESTTLKMTNNPSMSRPHRSHSLTDRRESLQEPILPGLELQKENTNFIIEEGVPFAKTRRLEFRSYAATFPEDSYEKSIWDLSSLLYDRPEPEATANVHHSEHSIFIPRHRKEQLARFWERLCEASAKESARTASCAEERAIAFLSAFKIAEACRELLKSKNYRLAILVSQIGGEAAVREDITEQINAWRELKALSEISEPIRAIYELLAGNTCICRGSGKAYLEDRAETFTISERFNMNWKCAFGLRLWYGLLADEPWEVAVLEKYQKDLKEGREPRTPFTTNDQEDPRDSYLARCQDVMWSLLVYCAEGRTPGVSQVVGQLTQQLLPKYQSEPALTSQMTFQLYNAFLVPERPFLHNPKAETQIIKKFANDLCSLAHWQWAVFVTLHLPDAKHRQEGIYDLLNANASMIGEQDSDNFKTLTDRFKIPSRWIFEAQALHAKDKLHDPAQQVTYLLRAENWDGAHDVLCGIVGPQAMIAQDLSRLHQVLETFREGKAHIANWDLGGRVFEDFLRLQSPDLQPKTRTSIVKRMLKALPAFGGKDHTRELTFEEKVAVKEMSNVVGKMASEHGEGLDGSKVLKLPMGSDGYRKQTQEMSMRYYQALMSH